MSKLKPRKLNRIQTKPIEVIRPLKVDPIIKKVEKREATSGIYVIICEIEKYVYVGQSKNIEGRLRNHKSVIQFNKYPPKTYVRIREHYLKHGIEAFQFIAILPCPFASLKELLERESEIMTEYARKGYILYNASINANVSAESIACPKELQPLMNDLINKLKSNIAPINEITEMLARSASPNENHYQAYPQQ